MIFNLYWLNMKQKSFVFQLFSNLICISFNFVFNCCIYVGSCLFVMPFCFCIIIIAWPFHSEFVIMNKNKILLFSFSNVVIVFGSEPALIIFLVFVSLFIFFLYYRHKFKEKYVWQCLQNVFYIILWESIFKQKSNE